MFEVKRRWLLSILVYANYSDRLSGRCFLVVFLV